MQKLKKFIKYNNLFVIILGLCLITVLPLKIDIPWVSAAVRTGLGKAIVLIVPEDMSVEEFLASLGLSDSGSFNRPKASSKIILPEQRNTAPEDVVLWLKDEDGDGILETKDFSRYVQEVKENENGEFLEITNNAMFFPVSYISIEIWLKEAPSGILLKAGESYQIEKQGSSLYFKLNNKNVGSLAVPSDAKVHQVVLSFDGINVHLGLDGKEKRQFTPTFATLSQSAENLLVNSRLESLRIFTQPMGEERFRSIYNELASNFGRESLTEEKEEVCLPNWVCSDWMPDPSAVLFGQQFIQTRTCTDQNHCGTSDNKPSEEQIAIGTYQPPVEEATSTEIAGASGGSDNSGEATSTLSSMFCYDADKDGFGNPGGPCLTATEKPLGYADNDDDCNDNDKDIHPGASEICDDGIDNDCDGKIDSQDEDCKEIISSNPEVTLTASNLTAATGTEITFTANISNFATTSLTFNWDFGDGVSESSETNSISHSYNATGTYNVSVTVTGGDQQASASTIVEIIQTQPIETCDSQHLNLCGNETDCATAGGYWYNDKCNSEPQVVCDGKHLNLCENEADCLGANGYWYNDSCHSDPQVTCSISHLDLCDSQEKCEAIGLYWYDNSCHLEEKGDHLSDNGTNLDSNSSSTQE
ncbi:MAG: PKD domain-containing protein [Candidatus Omnitrophica bacterium]|nr:PKD domain-containing protein [Candidatus Omnitrophota bacterium]